LDECNLRCQSRDAVCELDFATDNSLYKFDSSDDQSEMPTVGSFTYNNYNNVIDINIISVHVTKEGKRDFVIVDFHWYHIRKTLNILFNKFTGSAHEQIFCGMHNVNHGYSIIDRVDPMDGTIYWKSKTTDKVDPMDGSIYWKFKTIHNHSPEDDTVLV
jgi:hypothetical protein